MTPEQYRKAIARLGMTIAGAGRFLGVNERTTRRWASEGPIPGAVGKLLRLMVRLKLNPDDVK